MEIKRVGAPGQRTLAQQRGRAPVSQPTPRSCSKKNRSKGDWHGRALQCPTLLIRHPPGATFNSMCRGTPIKARGWDRWMNRC